MLAIPYKLRLSSDVCTYLAVEFLQHLLYLRQQIPSPISDLRGWCAAQESARAAAAAASKNASRQPRRLLSGAQKQVPKFLQQFDLLREMLGAVLADPAVLRVVVVFGSSVGAAEELYVLRFASAAQCDRQVTPQLLAACGRKMAGAWLQSLGSSVPQRPLRKKTRAHVLVEAPAGSSFVHAVPKATLATDKLFGRGRNGKRGPFCSAVHFFTEGEYDAIRRRRSGERSGKVVCKVEPDTAEQLVLAASSKTAASGQQGGGGERGEGGRGGDGGDGEDGDGADCEQAQPPPTMWYQFRHALSGLKSKS